jgi:predicted O-linked N-acetylglucosamine transferase (SPINDLY family)
VKSLRRDRAMCEWGAFARDASRQREALALGVCGALPPFQFLSAQGVSSAEQRACSELWTRERRACSAQERGRLDFSFDLAERAVLRIGYLSNDFQDHATLLLLIEALEAHDLAGFEPHAFSFGADDGGALRRRLRDAVRFHDISALSDAEAARAIHAAGIDILVDLKGFTQDARAGVTMLRPAPIQVNFLGYPGTMGQHVCDYIITDAYVTPPDSAADYAESFAFLPQCYQPHGRLGAIGAAPSRADMGLPATGVVFCCFNQSYKFTPDIFDLWCRLLALTPGSVLWLLANEGAQGNLRGEALRRGVMPDRLIFARDVTQHAHLARLQLADIVLDTAPYGAHTTASDALWVGAPVVTLAGDTFPSRVAGSLLLAVGLEALIAGSPQEYVDIAHALAVDPDRLAQLRAKLKRERMRAPLFDVVAYTRALERLYLAMWRGRRQARGPIWASPTGSQEHPSAI